MPASRKARAMTLAPRSWPSRPGLAITTRIFCMVVAGIQFPGASCQALDPANCQLPTAHCPLNQRYLFVLAPHLAERVAHLADGRVGAHTVEQPIHRVAGAARRLLEHLEGASDLAVVARAAQLAEPRQLAVRRGFVDVEDRDRRLVVLHVVVDADDDLLARLDGLLE